MKTKLFGLLCALLLLAVPVSAAQVTATGSGADEREALHQAMRAAVEQEVGVYLDSRTRVENFRVLNDSIYTQAAGYIGGYDIVKEEQIGGVYRVTIRANVLSEKLTSGPLSRLQKKALIGANLEDPRIGVLAVDDSDHESPALENALITALQNEGFSRLIDLTAADIGIRSALLAATTAGDSAAITALRSTANCDLLAIVRIERAQDSLDFVMPGLHKAYLTAAARLVNTSTGEITWAGTAYGESSHWYAGAEAEATQQVAANLAPRLAAAALGKAQTVEQHVRLLAPLALFGDVANAREELGALPGISHVFVRTLAADRLSIDLDYDGTAADCAAMLSRKGYHVTGLASEQVTLE